MSGFPQRKWCKDRYGPLLVEFAVSSGRLLKGKDYITGEEVLAPGVFGWSVEHKGELYIPAIAAEVEGSGAVGRYLDSLPRDKTIKIPTVISERLEGMLLRRGFHWETEFYHLGMIEIFVRRKS